MTQKKKRAQEKKKCDNGKSMSKGKDWNPFLQRGVNNIKLRKFLLITTRVAPSDQNLTAH